MRQIWGASKKAGYANNPVTGEDAVMEHAAFGAILGDDGRPFKTRTGDPVKLSALLDETASRALAEVTKRSPDLPAPEARTIAEAVGMAALKYADLSNERIKDYVFSFDRMLAFEGNTGPYLLYAVARIRNIFRKAAAELSLRTGWERAPLLLNEPQERQLALALLRYPQTVRSVAQSLEPHRLCQYLYELAGAFSSFYDACPVLKAGDDAVRLSRLRLSALTSRTLEDGLAILGIPVLERM
jgi:arginyl-tRNA synthetase